MDIRQLRYFVALAEELHFGRTALRVSVAQPAISQQIRQLEKYLGVTLFDRTGHGVKLTEAGRTLQIDARRILGLIEGATENARWASRGRRGNLTIGFSGSFLHAPLPVLIREFEQQYTDVSVKIVQQTFDDLRDGIFSDRVQLGSYHAWRPHRTAGMLVINDTPLEIALPKGHALLKERTIDLQSLRAESFVFYSQAILPGYAERIDAFCRTNGFVPNVVQDAMSLPAALHFVAMGRGVFLHPKAGVAIQMEGVAFRPVLGLSVPTIALWRPENTSSVLSSFLALLRRSAEVCSITSNQE